MSPSVSPPPHTFRPVFSACLEELESRDLLFSSLKRCPFGAFPALETIDTHMCQQLRCVSLFVFTRTATVCCCTMRTNRQLTNIFSSPSSFLACLLRFLSRESMLVSLVKAGAELEDYARSAEYSTASLIELLRPIFQLYEIPEVTLPKPIALSSYPMDFTPPERVAPPWGLEVNEALEAVERKIEDQGGFRGRSDRVDKEHDFALADECVKLVHDAFNRFADHEYVARIGRKNMQVMDRLSKMSTHKERMINALSAAVSIEALRQGEDLAGEVPIFWCRVVFRTAKVERTLAKARSLLFRTLLSA